MSPSPGRRGGEGRRPLWLFGRAAGPDLILERKHSLRTGLILLRKQTPPFRNLQRTDSGTYRLTLRTQNTDGYRYKEERAVSQISASHVTMKWNIATHREKNIFSLKSGSKIKIIRIFVLPKLVSLFIPYRCRQHYTYHVTIKARSPCYVSFRIYILKYRLKGESREININLL